MDEKLAAMKGTSTVAPWGQQSAENLAVMMVEMMGATLAASRAVPRVAPREHNSAGLMAVSMVAGLGKLWGHQQVALKVVWMAVMMAGN
jgi:hypothetical protein